MRLKTPEAFATTRRNLNAQHTCEAKTSSLPNERERRRPRDDNKLASKYNWPLSRAECLRLTDYTVCSLAAHSGQWINTVLAADWTNVLKSTPSLKLGRGRRGGAQTQITWKSRAIPYYCTTDIRFSSGGCAGGTWVPFPPPVGPRACIKFMSLVADMAPTAGAVSVSSVSSHNRVTSIIQYTARTQNIGLTIPTLRING